ncbi:MAG: hypothetical protein JRS35_13020 [Deltaproteobacteria bacterium]|nr:hypothetical protein [Deltaproteobacteria bacterium]
MPEDRPRLSPRRALLPILGLLDRSSKAACERPDPAEDGTRFPEFPWDLRTIILLFPPEAPFRFMNLNLLLGLTGVPFDRIEQLGDLRAEDAVDLQFCLEGRERCATYKRYHSIGRELSYRPGAVEFILGESVLGERLRFEGSWPAYRIEYRQPEAELSCTLHFASFENLHWWVRAPRLYCHYTSFGSCRMEWRWGSEAGVLEVPALHDHGWGRNLLPLGVPLRVFRYEVLRVPIGAGETGGSAIGLWTEGPFGMKLKQSGLLRRPQERNSIVTRVECRVLEWETFDNYAGRACRVPRRWLGRHIGDGAEFEYEAQRSSEPRAVLGNGFLCAFDYRGVWRGATEEGIEGEGYSEQLGWVAR